MPENQPSVEKTSTGVLIGILAAVFVIALGWWAWREMAAPTLDERIEQRISCENELAAAGRYVSERCREAAGRIAR